MTRKSLGDKFREAAGLIADGKSDSFCLALLSAGVGRELASRTMDRILGREVAFADQNHRVIALLTCAAMADTGDLK